MKSKSLSLNMVDLLMRLEIGFPFAVFAFPMSLFVGLTFAIVNSVTERKYHSCIKFRSQLYILGIGSLVNAIPIAIGLACMGTYVVNLDAGVRRVDYFNIGLSIGLTVAAPICMFALRAIFLVIQHCFLRDSKK